MQQNLCTLPGADFSVEQMVTDSAGVDRMETTTKLVTSTTVYRIDALKYGSLARFAAHCCGGGNVQCIYLRTGEGVHVGMFAHEVIREGDEIKYNYTGEGAADLAEESSFFQVGSCRCGHNMCMSKTMPIKSPTEHVSVESLLYSLVIQNCADD